MLFHLVRAMGAGDVKLAAALGCLAGLAGSPQLMFATAWREARWPWSSSLRLAGLPRRYGTHYGWWHFTRSTDFKRTPR